MTSRIYYAEHLADCSRYLRSTRSDELASLSPAQWEFGVIIDPGEEHGLIVRRLDDPGRTARERSRQLAAL